MTETTPPGVGAEGAEPPQGDAGRHPAPRTVVWESDVCAGVISGRSCGDCDDDDCEHECHEPVPEETPDA